MKASSKQGERLAAVSLDPTAMRLFDVLDKETSIRWEELPGKTDSEWSKVARAMAILQGLTCARRVLPGLESAIMGQAFGRVFTVRLNCHQGWGSSSRLRNDGGIIQHLLGKAGLKPAPTDGRRLSPLSYDSATIGVTDEGRLGYEA